MTTEQQGMIDKKLREYYGNDCKKMHKVVNNLLYKLKYHDVEVSDFYSLADEIIAIAIQRYDFKQDFDGYIYKCLENKFKTEMTRQNREKRKADKTALSLDTPIGDEESGTIEDTLASPISVENEVFQDEKEWRNEVQLFLDSLSPLQQKIAILLSDENTPSEICEELHITMKHYQNLLERIISDEKIKILRPLVERV